MFCTGWRISVRSVIIQQETEKYIKQKERETESFDRIFVSFSKKKNVRLSLEGYVLRLIQFFYFLAKILGNGFTYKEMVFSFFSVV